MVELLLKMGADANFTDINGRNSLHHAINVARADSNASFEMERTLISYSADPKQRDNDNRTPLHFAFRKIANPNDTTEIDPFETVSSLSYLLDQNDINVRDNL